MNKQQFFEIKVTCYEGYKACEKPLSFKWGNRQVIIKEIIDQWQGEDHRYFKILGDDNASYIIRHDLNLFEWQIICWETSNNEIISSLHP
ncbi:MAG: hypothetical protein A2Y62_05010 [Candidatus Fischerbacteria bacterium RBG_13_37_8]|uniref:Uncharacterized protein n=1 Tax=Candidatus Fischerbacteria bacterium RBG_13_37_8 TaxID=1817863 RepID=A0A1F5VUL9_9BACT|nr:MAG: hypothetical protein A2Y62_05010 [Candidatus Fischerbacteria bacterium RBG_13_37_8]